MTINDKPSYVREGHKWVLRIYPGGRNLWEQAPQNWQPWDDPTTAAEALHRGECAYVTDRATAEQAWKLFREMETS